MKTFLLELFAALQNVLSGAQYIEGDLNLGGSIIGLGLNVTSITAAYTVKISDDIILCSGTYTVTLPPVADATNQVFYIKNTDANAITVDGDGSETIDGSTTKVLSEHDYLLIVSDGSEWHLLRSPQYYG